MTKEDVVETMNWSCDNCGGEDDIAYPADKTETPAYIICSHCLMPSAYVWCDKCGMGGQIAQTEFTGQPNKWKCISCHSEYTLPFDFYQNPIYFQPTAFTNIEKIREKRFIREYGHVSIMGVKQGLLFWGKVRFTAMLSAIILFIIAAFWVSILESFLPSLSSFILFFSLVLIGLILLLNIITWLISKLFLIAYKYMGKRES